MLHSVSSVALKWVRPHCHNKTNRASRLRRCCVFVWRGRTRNSSAPLLLDNDAPVLEPDLWNHHRPTRATSIMEAFDFYEEQKKYDYIQYVVPDLYGLARGKIVKGRFKEKVAKKGYEVGTAMCVMGPNCEAPMSCLPLVGSALPNQNVRPCLDTLTAWPWVGSEGRRVGSVLCDLVRYEGDPDPASPRQIMKAQLSELREKHGLELRTAFEYEFNVYTDSDAKQPLGGCGVTCFDVTAWHSHHELFCDLCDLLEVMGIEVSAIITEFGPGQWELTTDAYEGERAGDVAFYLKHAVKGFFRSKGMTATFMSKPRADHPASGLHLNHSLWTVADGGRDGEKGEEEKRNVLYDGSDPDGLSSIARHWIAGIMHHAPALTSLCCPTLNCYRRLKNFCAPAKADWGIDNRHSALRARTAHKDNVFLENRLPSGAVNPYLAIAATVAAGMDGLNRKLECPQPMDTEAASLPSSLAAALEALEKDEELAALLGQSFVTMYTTVKRDIEVARFKPLELNTEEKQYEFERHFYMNSL